MREQVARVRQLLTDAVDQRQQQLEAKMDALAQRGFGEYLFNTGHRYTVDNTPRGRAVRQIRRIVTWYGWQHELEQALEQAEASSLATLSDAEIAALRAHFAGMESAQNAELRCKQLPARLTG